MGVWRPGKRLSPALVNSGSIKQPKSQMGILLPTSGA